MRPQHLIHISGIAACLAIASSVFFTYAFPSVDPVIAARPAPMEIVVLQPEHVRVAEEARDPKLGLPIADALTRITKKTFGLEVHPETSPVSNDRFNGFHVGVDFETTEREQDIDIPIFAVCDGPLRTKQFAKGYGGYALQSCELDGEDIVVLYGHMNIKSIETALDQQLKRGEVLGVLGKGYSTETDGVRKHLHLGIHRGRAIDIRGYVQTTSEIHDWLDPVPYLTP